MTAGGRPQADQRDAVVASALVAHGGCRPVLVAGAPGAGKALLVRRFLATVGPGSGRSIVAVIE